MTKEEKEAVSYARERLSNEDYPYYNDEYEIMLAFEDGVEWCRNNLWHPADGDDLPEIDKEVIALIQPCSNDEHLRVVFAHRPNKYTTWIERFGEKKIVEVERYGKGEWNIPDVKFWLDLELPKEEE